MVSEKKHLVLGITGSIAAYKTPQLVRELVDEGYTVKVVLTDAAQHFVAPLALETVSGGPVYCNTFADPLSHIDLAVNAAALVVAPATLNTIGKFAGALADNLLTCLFAAFRGPVIVAPAMNWRMYEHPVFQEKLDYLKARGVIEAPCETGHLACGESGKGRMAQTKAILALLKRALTGQDLLGRKVLIASGPTREYLDPVRFISNRSSGKMGAALAEAAWLRGAQVVLVTGPATAPPPWGVECVYVETSTQMEEAMVGQCDSAHIIIMAAAVADYRAHAAATQKMERTDEIILSLVKTSDISARLAARKSGALIVGFAAETGKRLDRAKEKLHKKGLDMIVFNDLTEEGAGFDSDTNIVTLITAQDVKELPKMSKIDVAHKIYDRCLVQMS